MCWTPILSVSQKDKKCRSQNSTLTVRVNKAFDDIHFLLVVRRTITTCCIEFSPLRSLSFYVNGTLDIWKGKKVLWYYIPIKLGPSSYLVRVFWSFILKKNSSYFISLWFLETSRGHFSKFAVAKKMSSGVIRPLSLTYLFPAQACVQYCCLNTGLGVQFSFRFFFFLCLHFRTGHLHVAPSMMCLRALQMQKTVQTFFNGHFFKRPPTHSMTIKHFSDMTFPNNTYYIPSDGQIFG